MVTFSVAAIKAKDPKNAELAARVENLSRLLGRRGSKKNRKEKT